MLAVAQTSRMMWMIFRAGTSRSTALRNRMDCLVAQPSPTSNGPTRRQIRLLRRKEAERPRIFTRRLTSESIQANDITLPSPSKDGGGDLVKFAIGSGHAVNKLGILNVANLSFADDPLQDTRDNIAQLY